MADFLQSLVDRTSDDRASQLTPRTASMFEPVSMVPELPTLHRESDAEDELPGGTSHPTGFEASANDVSPAYPTMHRLSAMPEVTTTESTVIHLQETRLVGHDPDVTSQLTDLEQRLERLAHFNRGKGDNEVDRAAGRYPFIVPPTVEVNTEGEPRFPEEPPADQKPMSEPEEKQRVADPPRMTPVPPSISSIASGDRSAQATSTKTLERLIVQNEVQAAAPIMPASPAPQASNRPSAKASKNLLVPHVAAPPVSSRRDKEQTPTITVTIGRIELQGADPPQKAATPKAPTREPASRVMSLDQYLALRQQGDLS